MSRTRDLIDLIIRERGRGEPALINATKAKLIMKGINPDRITMDTADNADVVKKLEDLVRELNITALSA